MIGKGESAVQDSSLISITTIRNWHAIIQHREQECQKKT